MELLSALILFASIVTQESLDSLSQADALRVRMGALIVGMSQGEMHRALQLDELEWLLNCGNANWHHTVYRVGASHELHLSFVHNDDIRQLTSAKIRRGRETVAQIPCPQVDMFPIQRRIAAVCMSPFEKALATMRYHGRSWTTYPDLVSPFFRPWNEVNEISPHNFGHPIPFGF